MISKESTAMNLKYIALNGADTEKQNGPTYVSSTV